MKAEIISVGTELLLGDVVNTNASYLSQKMVELGIFCYHHSVVGDNSERLRQQLDLSLKRSDLVLITGGLGPTYDDMTKETVAEVLDLELVYDEKSGDWIRSIFSKSKQELTENNFKQAYTIETGEVLENTQGTAPGVYVKKEDKIVVLLPGPPSEMKKMFEQEVVPRLRIFSSGELVSKNIYLTGIGESKIESILSQEMKEGVNPTIAPYSFGDGVVIRVMANALSEKEALALIQPVVERIVGLFESYVFSIDIPLIEEVVVQLLQQKGLKVAIAESCTGGLLAQRLTSIAGASKVFDVGLVTYSNQSKIDLLGVKASTIETYGAVSAQTVKEMAENVRKLAGADIGLAISGVAGPQASEHKPVGLVYIAVATADQVLVEELNLSRGYDDERSRIRKQSTTILFKMLVDYLNALN